MVCFEIRVNISKGFLLNKKINAFHQCSIPVLATGFRLASHIAEGFLSRWLDSKC